MSVLRNNKRKNVVVVKEGGLSYNEISDLMTKSGDKMNHNNVRAIMVKSFMKIADNIGRNMGVYHDQSKLLQIAISSDFQESVIEIITDELKKGK